MSGSVRRISSYGDLISDAELDVSAVDAVAHELDSGSEFVAWVPDWLLSQKDIESSVHHQDIVAGEIEHESDKAYLVSVGREEAWLPKSQIHVYTQAEDAEIAVPDTHSDADEGAGE